MRSTATFTDETLRRLAYVPEKAPPGLRLSGNYGADGHGGPGHQDAPDSECGTLPGMVCFRGALIHQEDGSVYQVDHYDLENHEWIAHWPD